MMSWLGQALVVALLFGMAVAVHEIGHFIAARWCGLVVDAFSIGFGPALWKKRYREVEYRLGSIPLGGYVILPQLDPDAMAGVQGQAGDGSNAPRTLPPVAPWKKILVSISGALGNLLFAVVLAWIVYLSGRPTMVSEASSVVGWVDTNSVAYARGLRPGDTILAVNGERVRSWQEFLQLAALSDEVTLRISSAESVLSEVRVPTVRNEFDFHAVEGVQEGMPCRIGIVEPGSAADRAGLKSGDLIKAVDGITVVGRGQLIELIGQREGVETQILVQRGGELVQATVVPRMDPVAGQVRIGIVFDAMVMTPWAQIRHDASGIVRMLRALTSRKEARKAAQGMGGPISILATFWLYVQAGVLMALGFSRFLNVNLAILNLLPIPVLDGGHVLFALWEAVARRPPPARVVNALVRAFAALLIGAMLLLSYKDVIRWSRIGRQWSAMMSESRATQTNALAAPPEVSR